MPLEGTEGTTPVKPQWSRISSFNESSISLDERDLDKSLTKSFLEGSKLDDIAEGLATLRISDITATSTSEDDTERIFKFEDLSLFEESILSLVEESLCTPAEEDADESATLAQASLNRGRHSAEYKYKISIYSKVSGCRFTNLTDYYIIKQVRVAILQHLAFGDPEVALKYKFGYEKMANGGLQIISDSKELVDMLGSLNYFAGIPCKMTFPDTPRVVGFVKGLPTDLEPSDLKDEIRKTYPEVYSVRYVTEKSRGAAQQRPCAFISFNLKILPKAVQIFNGIFELQVPNPMQCTRCCRYGHQGKQCRAQTRCSFCGGTHQRQLCTAKTPSCINCFGVHTATSHDCVIWQQGKQMNKLRYRGGLSAEDAINIASSGKVAQKKHIFTQADFFGNQDNYYFGTEDTVGPCDEFEGKNELPSDESTQITLGKVPPVHPKTCRIYPFLDLMTDFFMKVNNPGKQYSSAMLMPGYDENGFPTIKKSKRISDLGKHFKDSVQALIQTSSPQVPVPEL